MTSDVRRATLTDQLFEGTLSLFGRIVALGILGVVIFGVWFHIRVGIYGSYVALIQRPIHVMLFAFLVYMYDRRLIHCSGRPFEILDVVIRNLAPAALCVIVLRYQLVNYDELIMRMGLAEPADYFYGLTMLLLILEATRRAVGLPVALVGGFFFAYQFLGPYFPGVLNHPGFTLARIVGMNITGTNGVFFEPVGAMANFIVVFILFGVLLAESGTGNYLMDFSKLVVGRSVGGPAKLAVVSSAFMGTISGSVLANVVTTGSFTIPLMKKTGYKPPFAGAVEAVASTGGQIMPPIMGASAFIMAATLGIPYLAVAKAGALPAILYFLALFLGVHWEGKKTGIGITKRAEIPPRRTVLMNMAFFLLPIGALLYFLIAGYSMMRVGFALVVFSTGLCMIKRETRLTPRKLLNIMEKGMQSAMGVAVTVATAGIIVGSLLTTGLGFKITQFILQTAGGNLLAALLITGVIALILGMGMTTVAVYVILSSLLSSGLEQIGVQILAVHFFIFYFGNISHITPPVALGSYAAAAIAGSNFWKTSVESLKLGLVAILVPFFFVYNPVLLFIGTATDIILASISAVVGTVALSAGIQGWLLLRVTLLERAMLISCGLLMIKPGWVSDLIGLGLLIPVIVAQWIRRPSKALVIKESQL